MNTTTTHIHRNNDQIYFRLPTGLKQDAEQVFEDLHLSTSDALRLFLGRVVDYRGIPFALQQVGQATEREGAVAVSGQLRGLRGRLYSFGLQDELQGSKARLDLGFASYLRHRLPRGKQPDGAKWIVSERKGDEFKLRWSSERRDRLYSYGAQLKKIVDGDTLWLDVDCGFGVSSRQKVRLRGINAPEMSTLAGVDATRYLERVLTTATLAMTTTKPDKYGRYLADLFYMPGKADKADVLAKGRFLNRELLDEGYAERYA